MYLVLATNKVCRASVIFNVNTIYWRIIYLAVDELVIRLIWALWAYCQRENRSLSNMAEAIYHIRYFHTYIQLFDFFVLVLQVGSALSNNNRSNEQTIFNLEDMRDLKGVAINIKCVGAK